MALSPQLNDQHSSDWTLTLAELNSSRAIAPLDLINVISDFEVYEHIDKPYVTGKIVISDAQRIYERFDFQGGETLTIRIQRTQIDTIEPIKKTFIVDEVLNVARGNESSQALVLHLVEERGFLDVLQNVNKAYSGSPLKIIQSIAKDYFDSEVSSNSEEQAENNLDVIVPNLSPLEAMLWIKNRSTNQDGYPFFLFTTFAMNNYLFYDLGAMLSQKVMNPNTPFIYSQGIELGTGPSRLFQVFSYKIKNVENLSSIVNAGYVGAKHNFYDVTTAQHSNISFDIHKDLYEKTEKLNQRQTAPLISPNLEYKDKVISDFESRSIHNIFATKTITNGKTYSESKDRGAHKRRVIGNAMKHLLTKSPIEIIVNGREFLDGSTNYTIGNNIRVIFKATQDDNPSSKIDRKLSGDYLIHSARHVFQKEKCYSILLISKIANYVDDTLPVG